jgi:hypothetical protein
MRAALRALAPCAARVPALRVDPLRERPRLAAALRADPLRVLRFPTFDLALAVLAGIASFSLLSISLYLFDVFLVDPACHRIS